MFPLKEKILIRGCQAHINAGLGCGADYVAKYVPFYAPFSLPQEQYFGQQGGNWLRMSFEKEGSIYALEFAHLDRYYVPSGKMVKKGDIIAMTGNTGQITTDPHLHIQIFKDGKRIDPEKFDWDYDILPGMTCQEELSQAKAEIQKLNFEIGVVTPQRDKALADLAKEKAEHAEDIKQKIQNYDNWQRELDLRKKAEALLVTNQAKLDTIKGIVM